jgi:hypothetical protein
MNPEPPSTGRPGHDDAATPADLLTPHDGTAHSRAPESEPDCAPGIVDPRHLPVPEILRPPPPGLPRPG